MLGGKDCVAKLSSAQPRENDGVYNMQCYEICEFLERKMENAFLMCSSYGIVRGAAKAAAVLKTRSKYEFLMSVTSNARIRLQLIY